MDKENTRLRYHTGEDRAICSRILESFVATDEKLTWSGQTVPSMEGLDRVLRPTRTNDGKSLCIDVKKLTKQVRESSYTYPQFIGRDRGCLL